MSQTLRPAILGIALSLVAILAFGMFAVDVAQSQVPIDPPTAPAGDGVQTDRLGGDTRFETSVSISQESFPDGADDVFLARADEFPDALSGGTLTTGPILLVPQCDTIPAVVVEEIERVAPDRVVALGGVDAVCEQVLEDAAAAADAGSGSPEPTDSPSPEPTGTPTDEPTDTPTEECTEPILPIGEECPTDSPSPTPTDEPTDDPTDPTS